MRYVHDRTYVHNTVFRVSPRDGELRRSLTRGDLASALEKICPGSKGPAPDAVASVTLARDRAEVYKKDESPVVDQITVRFAREFVQQLPAQPPGAPAAPIAGITLVVHEYGILAMLVEIELPATPPPNFEGLSGDLSDLVDGLFPLVYGAVEAMCGWQWLRPSRIHFGLPPYLVEGFMGAAGADNPWHPLVELDYDKTDFRVEEEFRYNDMFIAEGAPDIAFERYRRTFGEHMFQAPLADGSLIEYIRHGVVFLSPAAPVPSAELGDLTAAFRPLRLLWGEGKVGGLGVRVALATQEILLSGQWIDPALINLALFSYDALLARFALAARRMTTVEHKVYHTALSLDDDRQREPEDYHRNATGLRSMMQGISPTRFNVFISHSSTAEDRASQLSGVLQSRTLKGRTVSCFLASRDIQAGDDWLQSLRANLVNADELCVLITRGVLEKPDWIAMEYGAATALHRRITGILYDGIRKEELPEYMRTLQLIGYKDIPEYAKQAQLRYL